MSNKNEEHRKLYLVINESKTAAFLTNDRQVAYEVRKGADTNCYFGTGMRSLGGIEYCSKYSGTEDCEIIGPISEDNINVVLPSDENFGIIIPPEVFVDLEYEVD